MKILFLTGCINQIGGIERVTLDWAHIFKESGNEVFIISYSKGNQEKEFDLLSEFDIRYLNEKPVSIRYAFLKGKLLRQQLRSIQPDAVIYVDSLLYLFFRPFISQKYKQIVWEHFNYTVTFGMRFRTISRKLAARFADVCVLLTEADAAMWRENCRCNAEIKVIPNPVREDVLVASRERADSLLKRKKQILFVGRLARQKQVPELVEIWSLVEKNHPQWELVIVGDGDESPLVEERIRRHDLQRVRLIGKTTDVFLYYRESQILVLSSAFEGLPLVLIEGLFFDLPEVSFDCPCGPEEIIEDGKNGFIIKDFDKIRFAEKLSELMGNDKMREEFSVRSKELSRKYLPENILPQWEKLFEKIK